MRTRRNCHLLHQNSEEISSYQKERDKKDNFIDSVIFSCSFDELLSEEIQYESFHDNYWHYSQAKLTYFERLKVNFQVKSFFSHNREMIQILMFIIINKNLTFMDMDIIILVSERCARILILLF